jgi:hypothetical protein
MTQLEINVLNTDLLNKMFTHLDMQIADASKASTIQHNMVGKLLERAADFSPKANVGSIESVAKHRAEKAMKSFRMGNWSYYVNKKDGAEWIIDLQTRRTFKADTNWRYPDDLWAQLSARLAEGRAGWKKQTADLEKKGVDSRSFRRAYRHYYDIMYESRGLTVLPYFQIADKLGITLKSSRSGLAAKANYKGKRFPGQVEAASGTRRGFPYIRFTNRSPTLDNPEARRQFNRAVDGFVVGYMNTMAKSTVEQMQAVAAQYGMKEAVKALPVAAAAG